MGTRESTIEFIEEQLSSLSGVRTRKMFGEYALYYMDIVVALVCDDQVFIKVTHEGKEFAEGKWTEGYAYPGAKMSMNITDAIDDREFFVHLVEITAKSLLSSKAAKAKVNPHTRG